MHGGARGAARRATIATLAVGALALAGGLVATLSHATVHPAGTNDIVPIGVVDTLRAGHELCQEGERAPAATATIELTATRSGPDAALAVAVAGASATRARPVAAAWPDGETAVVPLRPPVARERAIRLCLRLSGRAHGATVMLYGAPAEREASATDDGQPLGGRMRLDYLPASAQSWWTLAPTVVTRIGRGRAWSGSSVALLAALLTLTSIALAAWLLARTS
jgi:hypothetical protein